MHFAKIFPLLCGSLLWPLAAAELGPVTAKDTLWSLAKAAKGDSPSSTYQVILALQQKNPRAFIGNNVHHVQFGAVLQIPTAAEIAAIDPELARQKVEADEQRWQQLQLGGGKRKQNGSGSATSRLIAAQQQAVARVQASTQAVQLTTPATPAVPASQPALVKQQQAHWTDNLQSNSTLGLESRVFAKQGLQQQARMQNSVNFLQEWYWQAEDESHSWTFSPYLRWDQRDAERHLIDIRQAFWLKVGSGWELKLGVDQVFWGVTESQHLVDIVNQTDLADSIDGESKLGQPMLQLNLFGDFGNLQTFVLPYFRERTLPGLNGRLRLPLVVEQDNAVFASDDKKQHIDWALRYAKQIDQLDIGLSYFQGTSREPGYVATAQGTLLPYYGQIKQLGLDAQWIVESWIWKLEAIRRAEGLQHYRAVTGGFEYSMVGILDSDFDLGWLMEYQYDSRGVAATSIGQRDLFVGTRLAWNDAAGTELLLGIAQDLDDSGSRSGLLEASTRYSNNLRLRLDAWFFQTSSQEQPIWWLRQDDYVQFGIDYYF